MIKVEIAFRADAEVGESPVWCKKRQLLWWVDIPAGQLHAFSPVLGTDSIWEMGEPIGCVGLTSGDMLIVGLCSGVYLFDPETSERHLLAAPEAHLPLNRPNDAAMSRDGRFFIGTMAQKPDGTPQGSLYRIDPDGSSHHLLGGLHVPNGLAVSPDNRTLYLSDSWPSVRRIWAFDLDADGNISNRRPFFDTAQMPGRPDGACVDEKGGYWSAAIEGGELLRLLPDGTVNERLTLPLKKPTKPCFGGTDMSTLFVTSLSSGDDSECAGALLSVDTTYRGLPEPRMDVKGNELAKSREMNR